MQLDRFQQFVKDGQYEPNLTVIEAKAFIRKLDVMNFAEADDVESNVNGAIDFGEIYNNSKFHVESLSTMKMNDTIKLSVNELIKATLEEIEDIEDEPEEDCMDAYKRSQELSQ